MESEVWGGADESYEAVDFQNMALALSPVSPVESVAVGSANLGNMVLPSFHRPALVNYWSSQVPTSSSEPNLLRKIMLRPNWYDHPEFTGQQS